jgi:hypothetical protein
MKKLISLVVFGLLLVSMQVTAQPKPFIGYDKVAWGASVADVRKAYSIGEDIAVEADENEPNIAILLQEQVSNTIEQRIFFFIGDKLASVMDNYKDGSEATLNQLKALLEQRYGMATDTKSESGSIGNIYVNFPYEDTTIIFGKFAPEIEVQLFQRKLKMNIALNNTGIGSNVIQVNYNWRKFVEDYFVEDYKASNSGL